jgi:hypothetical protein
LHRPVTVYTASVFLPKDAVVVRFLDQTDAVDSTQHHFPAVSLLERLQVQSRTGEKSFDVTTDQENVSGGMATAVGAAHATKPQAVGIERRFTALGTPVGVSAVGVSLSGGSLE